MLELGCNLDIQDSQGRTPIHLCCILKNIQLLNLIFQYINSGKYAGEINLNILDKKYNKKRIRSYSLSNPR